MLVTLTSLNRGLYCMMHHMVAGMYWTGREDLREVTASLLPQPRLTQVPKGMFPAEVLRGSVSSNLPPADIRKRS